MTDKQREIINNKWSWVNTESPAFSHALDSILNTNKNLTIIGPGGVGKSILLKMAADLLTGSTVVLSTTGVSAANLAGEGLATSTVHSFFRLPPVTIIEAPQLYSDLTEVMQNIDTILIDEVSMLNASAMDSVLYLMRKYRTFTEKPMPRFIFFGDVLQLPPVIEDRDKEVIHLFERKYNGKVMFFNATMYKNLDCEVIHLNEVYRQSDMQWKNILSHVRTGEVTKEDLSIINTRVVREKDFIKSHDMMMYLAATNMKVNSINSFYLNEDKGRTYHAEITGGFDIKGTNLQAQITIAPGMQIIATHNNHNSGYQNGTLGIALSVHKDYVSVKTNKDDVVEITRDIWSQYKYNYNAEKDMVLHESVGEFKQIGCKPAFAATIHKAQGLTLDALLLDPYGLNYMTPGLAYVALSRCTSLNGIGLTRPLTINDIRVSEEGLEFIMTAGLCSHSGMEQKYKNF